MTTTLGRSICNATADSLLQRILSAILRGGGGGGGHSVCTETDRAGCQQHGTSECHFLQVCDRFRIRLVTWVLIPKAVNGFACFDMRACDTYPAHPSILTAGMALTACYRHRTRAAQPRSRSPGCLVYFFAPIILRGLAPKSFLSAGWGGPRGQVDADVC